MAAGGAEQFGGGGVVEEPGQWPVLDRDVAGEDRRPGRGVGVAPLGEAVEEVAQHHEGVADAAIGQVVGVVGGTAAQVGFERLDVAAFDVGDPGHRRGLVGEEAGKLAQPDLDAGDGRRAEADRHLVHVVVRRGGHRGWQAGPLLGSGAGSSAAPCGGGEPVQEPEVEQGCLQPECGRVQAVDGVRGPMPAGGVQQLLAGRAEVAGAEPVRGVPADEYQVGQRGPLPAPQVGTEAEFGARHLEALVELGVRASHQLPDLSVAGEQVVGAEPDPAGGDQPVDEPVRGARDTRLLCQRGRGEPAGTAETSTHLPGGVDLGGVDRGLDGEVGDKRGDRIAGVWQVAVRGQRGHRAPPASVMAWASIASTARRYSPASQSSARCR